jgi:geranylgeranyl diphosphate synthase type I
MSETTAGIDTDARVAAIFARYREPLLDGMRAALDRPGIEHLRYMRYHLGWEDAEGKTVASGAGKMLRPALCLLCCEAVGGDIHRALPAAVAIELLHNFTLIHDDIEDESETRHGRPTLWSVNGIAQAINAGDGMFALAQRTLLDLVDTGVAPERVLAASRLLNDACIALCEGQYGDLMFESRARVTRAEYEAMIGGKTSALLGAAAAIGALAGGVGADAPSGFGEFGLRVGLAFQIQDDVLGIWGEPNRTGKSAAGDIRSRKKSFPVVYAFDHLGSEQRLELERIYAASTIDEPEVEIVLGLLDAAGAHEAATAAAQSWALAALEPIVRLALDAERRADLEAVARFAVSRRA